MDKKLEQRINELGMILSSKHTEEEEVRTQIGSQCEGYYEYPIYSDTKVDKIVYDHTEEERKNAYSELRKIAKIGGFKDLENYDLIFSQLIEYRKQRNETIKQDVKEALVGGGVSLLVLGTMSFIIFKLGSCAYHVITGK